MQDRQKLSEEETRVRGLGATVQLNNGVEMPWLGLGVFEISDDAEAERVVRRAIESGYRHIDTAALYGNERGVGAAVRTCGLERSEVFVTSKVWTTDMRSDRVEAAFEESLRKLDLDYVDLYLLHWPIEGKIGKCWSALEKFYREGWARAIGVSNHLEQHLEELLASAGVMPAVNQIEYHPYLQSAALRAYCDSKQIQLEAWSPFMHGGDILRDPTLAAIGERYGKTSAQVIVRWILQSGVATIPKTTKEARMVENSSVFDFKLGEEEMAQIKALDRGARWGADPANFDF